MVFKRIQPFQASILIIKYRLITIASLNGVCWLIKKYWKSCVNNKKIFGNDKTSYIFKLFKIVYVGRRAVREIELKSSRLRDEREYQGNSFVTWPECYNCQLLFQWNCLIVLFVYFNWRSKRETINGSMYSNVYTVKI